MFDKSKLHRELGFWDGASLIVANVIGVGIFTTPGIVAGLVLDAGSFLLVWILGGIFSLIGALAYSELSAKIPKAGGEYIYLRQAFGPLCGFLSGWTSFIAGFPGAIAAASIGFAAYLKNMVPETVITGQVVSAEIALFDLFPFQTTVAIVLITLITVLHVLKVNIGKRLQNMLTLLSILTILVLIGLGLITGGDSYLSIQAVEFSYTPDLWLLALIPVMFTYSGWNAAVYVAEEVRNPEKNMYKAMMLGTSVVVILYLMLNLVYLKSASMEWLSGSIDVGTIVAKQLSGSGGQLIVTAVILAALVSSISAMVMAGPRVYFAMARDGLFPKAISKVNPVFKTPALAVVIQSAWTVVMILTGTFEELLTYTGFAIVLFSSLSVLALLVMEKESLLKKPIKNTAYILFIGVGLAMTLNAIICSPFPSLAGLFMISTGIPVYLWFKKRVKHPDTN